MKKTGCTGALLALLMLLTLSACGEEEYENIPEAQTMFYVLDEADVLTPATEEYIIAVNDSLESQTGAQVVVVCVQTTGTASTEEYTKDLFNKWQIGDAEKNNGVLLLLTIREDDYWMLQGKGLEDTFSSGTIKLMLNQYLEPDFAVGSYDAGVRKIFDAAVEHLAALYSVTVTDSSGAAVTAENPAPSQEETPYRESSPASILGWAIMIVIVILLIIGFTGGGGGGNYRRRRHVVIPSAPRPRHGGYPYGTRMPRPTSRPPLHRPGSYGGTIGGSRPGGTIGGSRPGGSFGGGSHGGGGGFSRGGGAGRR